MEDNELKTEIESFSKYINNIKYSFFGLIVGFAGLYDKYKDNISREKFFVLLKDSLGNNGGNPFNLENVCKLFENENELLNFINKNKKQCEISMCVYKIFVDNDEEFRKFSRSENEKGSVDIIYLLKKWDAIRAIQQTSEEYKGIKFEF